MVTSAEIQMIRNADPGAILPGIDTPTGNPDPASSLMSYTQITQNAKGSPYYYVPANNEVYRHAERRRPERNKLRLGDAGDRGQQCDRPGLHVHRDDELLDNRSNSGLQRSDN